VTHNFETLPATKLRELVRVCNERNVVTQLLRIADRGSIEAVADTNDTKSMAGDISAIPAACIVGTAKRWAL
jgi:hypothetical protein